MKKVDNVYHEPGKMSEAKPFITLSGVCKEFNGRTVLSDVSVTIKEGERLGLLGRSGAGKSVLLHMLRGSAEYMPTAGEILFRVAICPACAWIENPSKAGEGCRNCGTRLEVREVNYGQDDEGRRRIKKRVAIMLQRTFGLYGEDTVLFNVLQALERSGCPSEQWFRKAYELLNAVKLIHRISFPAAYLSGGEKQRLVLARQLAFEPLVLLADEPTGTLDFATAELVHDALRESTKRRGMTMVLTAHQPEALEALTEKLLWLEDGRVIGYGDTRTILEEFKNQLERFTPEPSPGLGKPKLQVERCTKYYTVRHTVVKAVDQLSFTIYEHEIFGLVGPSGAGKTSLARILAQVEPLSEGSVKIRIGDTWVEIGRGVRRLPETAPKQLRELLATHVAILHQEYSLYPEKTVLENLTSCIGLKMPAELARLKASYMLQGIGFSESVASEVLQKTHAELSVGERQRVALAQILMKEPALAILDEPTGSMDPATRQFVADAIRAARRNLGITFLLISHDLEFAYTICDRIAHMHEGKITRIEEVRSA